MFKSRLNILMAERNINKLTDLQNAMEKKGYKISYPTLHRIFHGNKLDKMNLESVVKLIKFFNCSFEELFDVQ